VDKPENLSNIYEQGILENITGHTLRPGGFELTNMARLYCQFPEKANILDVGCGTGATVQFLRENCGLNAWGIDSSAEMIRRGKEFCADLPLLQASGENIPFPCNQMDGVFMECSLSLISDADFALTESCRILKENGKLVISDFYYRNRPGTKTKELLLSMLEEHDFEVALWQDKSELLGQLVFDSIMQNGSTHVLWDCLLANEKNRDVCKSQLKIWQPSYFLLVANKRHTVDEQYTDPYAYSGECGITYKEEDK
jgi:SAM-dependent methyltransferase